MLSDADYDAYCRLMAALKQHPVRKRHRLPSEAYAASDVDFFFTLCAHARLSQPFTRPDLAQAVVDSLLWTRQRYGWVLYCYCLMPDHLHFIVRLPQSSDKVINAGARGEVTEGLLEHVARFKSFTTTQVWRRLGGEGPLWQRSSYDAATTFRRSLEPAVRYVLNNPVRRGLVEDWTQYPYARLVDGVL